MQTDRQTDGQTGRQADTQMQSRRTEARCRQTDRLKISDVKYSGVSDQN